MFSVGYVRVSTREQVATPARQREAIEQLCREKGWELLGVYEDIGVSGFTDPFARPGFKRAVEELEERGGGVLVAWSLDRVTRGGPTTLSSIMVELFRRRITLFTVRERSVFEMMYSGGMGSILAEAQATVLALIAKLEREFTRMRTREAMANPEVRRRMEGNLRRFYEERLGLRVAAATREQVVTLYRQGWSLNQIAKKTGLSLYRVRRILAEEGLYKPPRGVCPRCFHKMRLLSSIPPRYYCEHCGYETTEDQP